MIENVFIKRTSRIAFAVVFILFGVSIWSFRVHATAEAAKYAPAPAMAVHHVISAGTLIQAESRTKMPASIAAGDAVTLFVSTAVISEGQIEIPEGAQLRCTVDNVLIQKRTGEAHLKVTDLVIQGRSLAVQAVGTATDVPIQSDFGNIRAGLQALFGVAVGASIGAASGYPRLLDRGWRDGSRHWLKIDTI